MSVITAQWCRRGWDRGTTMAVAGIVVPGRLSRDGRTDRRASSLAGRPVVWLVRPVWSSPVAGRRKTRMTEITHRQGSVRAPWEVLARLRRNVIEGSGRSALRVHLACMMLLFEPVVRRRGPAARRDTDLWYASSVCFCCFVFMIYFTSPIFSPASRREVLMASTPSPKVPRLPTRGVLDILVTLCGRRHSIVILRRHPLTVFSG